MDRAKRNAAVGGQPRLKKNKGGINVVNGSEEKNMSLVRIMINSRLSFRKP